MDFDDLFDDAILHIFKFLPLEDLLTACQVSMRWRSLADWKPLWQNTKLTFFTNAKPDKVTLLCLKLAPVLDVLEIREKEDKKKPASRDKYAKALRKVYQHHPQGVRKLSISNCTIKVDDLLRLVRCFSDHVEEIAMRKLTILNSEKNTFRPHSLGHTPMLRTILTDPPFLRNIKINCATCPNLEEICLEDVQDYSFPQLLENNAILRTFSSELKNIKISGPGLSLFLCSKEFLAFFPKLEILSVTGGDECFEWNMVHSEGVSLFLRFTALRTMFYKKTDVFQEMEGLDIVKNLTLCCHYYYSGIKSIFDKLNQLKQLTILQDWDGRVGTRARDSKFIFAGDIVDFAKYAASNIRTLKVIHVKGTIGFVNSDKAAIKKRIKNVQAEYTVTNARELFDAVHLGPDLKHRRYGDNYYNREKESQKYFKGIRRDHPWIPPYDDHY